MAAVAHLALLLFAFINNIHSEELIIILKEGDSHTFRLINDANSSCLISRSVGEEKLVLWNTSDSFSENSTLPDGLKQQLSVSSTDTISHYTIHKLTHSDSGQYQEECWTNGNVTYERNISLIICSMVHELKTLRPGHGETVDLRCEEAADNLEIQWLMLDLKTDGETWMRVFWDGMTSVTDIVKGGFQVMKKASGPRQSNIRTTVIGMFTCLVMNQHQCVSSRPVHTYPPDETIYHSVGETAVLQCTGTDSSDEEPPLWKKMPPSSTDISQEQDLGKKYSLVLSSVELGDSGFYTCDRTFSRSVFYLVVCPEFGPPDVELFSGGEEVTIRCRDWSKGLIYWFMKSTQTRGRVIPHQNFDLKRIIPSHNLVISNVSLEDTGEYWCAVMDPHKRCVSTTKTLLKYRGPLGV